MELTTDRVWEFYGSTDPYFGVLTAGRFRDDELDDDRKLEFFATGEDYVSYVFDTARGIFHERFAPRCALDFGCGVGRITVPLARRCHFVVGVDVSSSMLDEARKNADAFGLSNIDLVISDDTLSCVTGVYDLVHSFIVFQHIPPSRAELILSRLIEKLSDGGIGIVHFTYADATRTPFIRRGVTWAYEHVPGIYRFRTLARRQPSQPTMQMNRYNMSRLLRLLQESGCHDVHLRFTETSHYGYPIYGAILFFSKRRFDTTRYS